MMVILIWKKMMIGGLMRMSESEEKTVYEKFVAAQVETDLNRTFDVYVEQVRKGFTDMWGPHSTASISVSGTPPCPLCAVYDHRRRILTPLHYEDDKVIVIDCMSCGVPMVILKRHAEKPIPIEAIHMGRVVVKLFGEKAKFRDPASIKSHYHIHVDKR